MGSSLQDGVGTSVMERADMSKPRISFGECHFGGAELGDERRSRRLPQLVDEMLRHPGGTLPQKLPRLADLEAFYRLCDADDVTHETVMGPHRKRTLQYLQTCENFALAIHDATELDYSTHATLVKDMGQIGNGNQRGYMAQNTLVVDPTQGCVVGFANQILHVREKVKKKEKQAEKRVRDSRESLLWLKGTIDLPQRRQVVDVCDRGADTFEFLEHEMKSHRTFVIRSAYDRGIFVGHGLGSEKQYLHQYARTLPEMGTLEMLVTQKEIVKKPKKTGKKTKMIRTMRSAQLSIAAAPVQICAPTNKNGNHTNEPQPMWIVRVWETNPPPKEPVIEWLLLTNHPIEQVDDALQVKKWYEWRWTIEELHKAKKTGCGIERLQMHNVKRLQPAIAIISILALTLLALRDNARNPNLKNRRASEQIDEEYIQVLSLWRHGTPQPEWTNEKFYMALARLGGHPGRKSSQPPGWLVLWRGWEKLQIMIDGARLAARRLQRETSKASKKCA
jgi:hypothetical protein